MTEGIILKRINYEETSYILNVITSEGFYPLIVRGAKRKNSEKLALSEPLNLISFEKTNSKNMPSLKEGIILNDYKKIKESLEMFSISSLISEYMLLSKDALINTSEAYNLIKATFDELENGSLDKELVLFHFEIILLRLLGSSINIEHLKEEYQASNELIDALKSVLNNDLSFDKRLLREFFKEYFYKECGLKLRSYKLYLNLFK